MEITGRPPPNLPSPQPDLSDPEVLAWFDNFVEELTGLSLPGPEAGPRHVAPESRPPMRTIRAIHRAVRAYAEQHGDPNGHVAGKSFLHRMAHKCGMSHR